MNNYAVIVAAGKSERFGEKLPKQFHPVAGRPLLAWTIAAFEKAALVDHIILVISAEFQALAANELTKQYKFLKVSKIVSGGTNRKESVLNGLKAIPANAAIVAIHDGVRALTNPTDIDRVIETAQKSKAAMLAVPSKDTVKEVAGDTITKTLDRKNIWLAQTPQAFEYKLILEAHTRAGEFAEVTDDSLLVEKMGVKVKVIEPISCNLKVTTPEDMRYVETILKARANV